MSEILEKISELEEELRTSQYNKRTEHHIGLVKAKIARLKDELEKKREKAREKPSKGIRKSGDATISIVGAQSSGKSTLLNALTGARSFKPEINIGILKHQGELIQVLEIPSRISKEALSVIRNSDLVIILVEAIDLKQIGKKPDLTNPLIMKYGDDVEVVCKKLHKDFLTQFKYAKIWGPSSRYARQTIDLKHKLLDKDVLQVHLK